MRFIYLHGFASGPLSRKAQFFRQRFAEAGIDLIIPALDGDDFRGLTITGQLAMVDELAGGNETTLIGSSLGGYVAALYAAAHDEVKQLVLLAPAFGFTSRWEAMFGAERMEAWRATGSVSVFHYGEARERELGYQFFEDAGRYEPYPDFRQRALLIHGTADDVVPVAASEQVAATHPNARLVTLDAGHELTDVLERVWAETAQFLSM